MSGEMFYSRYKSIPQHTCTVPFPLYNVQHCSSHLSRPATFFLRNYPFYITLSLLHKSLATLPTQPYYYLIHLSVLVTLTTILFPQHYTTTLHFQQYFLRLTLSPFIFPTYLSTCFFPHHSPHMSLPTLAFPTKFTLYFTSMISPTVFHPQLSPRVSHNATLPTPKFVHVVRCRRSPEKRACHVQRCLRVCRPHDELQWVVVPMRRGVVVVQLSVQHFMGWNASH